MVESETFKSTAAIAGVDRMIANVVCHELRWRRLRRRSRCKTKQKQIAKSKTIINAKMFISARASHLEHGKCSDTLRGCRNCCRCPAKNDDTEIIFSFAAFLNHSFVVNSTENKNLRVARLTIKIEKDSESAFVYILDSRCTQTARKCASSSSTSIAQIGPCSRPHQADARSDLSAAAASLATMVAAAASLLPKWRW